MRIRIEVDDSVKEEEVVVKCKELNSQVITLQKQLSDLLLQKSPIVFYKGEKEFYLPLRDILFFETEENGIRAHTRSDAYMVKYKLYELEDLLPRNFLRISKSTIVNVDPIYSITRNLTASSVVEFQSTHKQVYVSRSYFKVLKEKLKEKRN